MPPSLVVLLGLGLCLDQRTGVQSGTLSQPSIWAEPGNVVPQGSSVTVYCRIPPGMTEWHLDKHESYEMWYDKTPRGTQELAQFSLQVRSSHAGTYYCHYGKQIDWSERSDPLKLVVTAPFREGDGVSEEANLEGDNQHSPPGVYKHTPSLMAHPGPRVTVGANVTLLCHSVHHFEVFNLSKDGGTFFPNNYFLLDHKTFLISPVTSAHGGTYRCYGSTRHSPFHWSEPSNPLELFVTDPPGPEKGYFYIPIGITAAVVFLLFFLLLLCRHWYKAKHRATGGKTTIQVQYKSSSLDFQEENQDSALNDIQPEEDRKMDTQVPSWEGSQELIYAQLHHGTPMGSVDPLPSCTLKDSSTQPCVYATLTRAKS